MNIFLCRHLLIVFLFVISTVKLADALLAYHQDSLKREDTEQQESSGGNEEKTNSYKANDENAEIILHHNELFSLGDVQSYNRRFFKCFFPVSFFSVPTPPPWVKIS